MSNIMMRVALIALAGTMFPVVSLAQSNVGLNPAYRRAQTMVNDGNATAGRALIDSMIGVATPGTNEYAEGVYWRAVLAATAAEAEADYRRIIVDHTLSPRVEDALLRLAQMDMARANYDGALMHLNRLVLEHPNGTSRPRAGYWTARVLFEKNDIPRACAANADALSRTNENDAELRNQITYLNQRCAGVIAAAAAPTGGAIVPSQSTRIGTDSATNSGVVTGTTTRNVPTATTTATTTERPSETAPVPASSPATSSNPRVAERSPVEPRVPASNPTTASPDLSDDEDGFSVQVAAYNLKSQAEAMVTKLKRGGYEARISGEKAPFRVRIGRYATRAQAAAVQRSLKTKQITGFVVQAETR